MLFNIFRKYGYKIYEKENGKFIFYVKAVPFWGYRYINFNIECDTVAMAIWEAQESINRLKLYNSKQKQFPKLLGTFYDNQINIDNIPVRELFHENAKCDGG